MVVLSRRLQFLLLRTGTDQQEGLPLVRCHRYNQEEVDMCLQYTMCVIDWFEDCYKCSDQNLLQRLVQNQIGTRLHTAPDHA